MYCTNCGCQIDSNAMACLNCGANPRMHQKYCHNCGRPVGENAIVCTSCGVSFGKTRVRQQGIDPEQKDWLTTLLLCVFLGAFGAHRFYTGHIGIGVIQLITFGGCGIWSLIDMILIANGSYLDANGKMLFKD